MAARAPQARAPVAESEWGRGRGNATGRATREVIMVAAERLFADRGVYGVSLREIGLAAGQRNNNVIPYHFGDRAGLVRAIYAFRSVKLDRRRFELLDELDRGKTCVDPYVLVEILLQPHAESLDDDENQFVGLLARLTLDLGSMATDPSFAVAPSVAANHEIRNRLYAMVGRRPRARFEERYDFLFNFAITALAIEKRRRQVGQPCRPVKSVLDDVVEVMVAGLLAKAPPPGAPAPT